jgi:hypothetical protein
VEVGEEVAISYSVIADRTWPDSSHTFYPISDNNPYLKKWKNNQGLWLHKTALPLRTGAIIWAVTVTDDRINLIDGAQGSEKDADRFLAQFSFEDTGKYKHTNQLDLNGKIYWKCEKMNIFAKRVNGNVVSVTDRVILEPVAEDWTERYRIQGLLHHPNDKVQGMYLDRGKVVSGGQSIGLEQGDIAGFEPRFCEKYTLWGNEYFLVKESRIDLIWQENQN